MKTLKFTLALILVSLITISFNQEKPFLVIEHNGGQ
jgi:hypothetical protein